MQSIELEGEAWWFRCYKEDRDWLCFAGNLATNAPMPTSPRLRIERFRWSLGDLAHDVHHRGFRCQGKSVGK